MEKESITNQTPGNENSESRDENTKKQTEDQAKEKASAAEEQPEQKKEPEASQTEPETEKPEPSRDKEKEAVSDEKEKPVPEEEEKPVSEEKEKPVPEEEEKPASVSDEKKQTPSDEEHHDDEEDEDEGDDDSEETEKYDTYPRERLVEMLEEIVESGDIPSIKTKVALIKVAFLKLTREEDHKKYEEYIAAGGDKEDFDSGPDPLVDKFNKVFERYKERKAKYIEEQEVLKLRNLDAKNAILDELRELVSSDESLKSTYDKFKELQIKWKEIGLVPAGEVNNLWQNYHFLVEKFFDKVKISKELRDLDLKKNLDKKLELCEKAEELLIEKSIVKSFKELQKYHHEWKEIGPVPSDKTDEIWERFKAATDKINERRRQHYSELAGQREQNLLAKTALCDKAEQIVANEINTIKEWQVKTDEINELFKVWKTIGPASKKDNDVIWDRFKTCLNTFFSNKKEFFNEIKQEQLNNYNLKLDLCKQAEAIKDSTDWRKTTNDLINLQKEWKKIGPVPRRYSDKIWARFRAACDEFFNRKSDFFANIGEREKENLGKKKELIEKIKKHEFGDNKEENLDILKGFQREWTGIGHVPIKEKDKIQNEFRKAIDEKLDKLNISSVEIKTAGYAEKVENLKDSPDSRRNIRKEMGFLNGKINKIKEDINLWENNIGFLAKSKKADLLKKEFEKKINKAKEEVALYEAKLKYLREAQNEA